MKKIMVMASILFICSLGVLLYYFTYYKRNADKEIIELNKKQVSLINSVGLSDININDVVISNIKIKDNRYLNFNIKSTKTNLFDKIISVYLFNDYAKNPGPIIEKNLNEVMNNNECVIDIKDIYNNPTTLEFDIK